MLVVINDKMNSLLEHINLVNLRDQLKLSQSTDRTLYATRMKVWESEASNYDKIILNLE